MQSKLKMHLSKRCLAKTRRATACQSPAMPNGRCRMHGGMSTGAPKGNKNAFKHGMYRKDTLDLKKHIRSLLRDSESVLEELL